MSEQCQCDRDAKDHDMWCCERPASRLVRRGMSTLEVCDDCVLSDDRPVRCLDQSDECAGMVRMHMTGDSFKVWPRCDFHQDRRQERYERSDLERYANSDVPPSWFDPAAAGEHWDEDY